MPSSSPADSASAPQSTTDSRLLRWLPPALLVLGAALRLRQYFANRSLWQDESSLALNLIERGFRGLLEPLDYGQLAPPGFLWLEKAVTLVFGSGELALRLVPLAFGLASLPLFDAVARRCLSARGRVVALALFATAAPLVWYASEVKQYGGDVTLGLALTALALEASRRGVSVRTALALGAVGAAALWFSHAAILVMAGIGIALALDALRRRNTGELARLAIPAVLWTASAATFWWLFLQENAGNESFRHFWRFAFFPLPPERLADVLWLPERLVSMVDEAAGLRPAALGAAFFVGGVIALAARRGRAAAVLGLPGAVALGTSALELYPFFQRFLLFFTPAVLIFASEAADRSATWLSGRKSALRAAGIGLPALLVAAPVGLGLWHLVEPPTRDHVRPALRHVAERARPDDLLWVYHGASRQFRYYAPRFGLQEHSMMISFEPVTDGLHRRWAEWPRLEFERLRGRGRVWVVFANVRSPGKRTDEEVFVEWLDLHARRLDAVHETGASAYLYDLGAGPGRERR